MMGRTSTLVDLALSRAEESRDAPFLTDSASGETVTYGEMWGNALRLSTVLADHDVRKGARLGVLTRDAAVFFPSLLACAATGAILVPMNPSLHPNELAVVIDHSDPTLIIADAPPPAAANARVLLGGRALMAGLGSLPTPREGGGQARRASDPLLLSYVQEWSGSARAVVLTHANLLSNATALIERFAITKSDRFHTQRPPFDMSALMLGGLVPMIAGGRGFFADVDTTEGKLGLGRSFWTTLSTFGITIPVVVPSFMAILLDLFPTGPDSPTRQLRFALCDVALLRRRIWRRFEKTFGLALHGGYGLTETTLWAATDSPRELRRDGAVGRPLACEIRISTTEVHDEDVFFERRASSRAPRRLLDRRRRTRMTGVGEICVRGPIVSPAYFRERPDSNEFVRTGDVGRLDADGRLHVIGRLKEVVLKDGLRIAANELDAAFASHPAVRESKTIGVHDDVTGERIHTACVLNDATVSVADLHEFIRSRVSDYKRPDDISVLGSLPRTPAGKVSASLLRRIVSGDLCDEIIAALTTARDRRAPPFAPERMRALVQRSLTAGTPIRFLSFWGCGVRARLGDVDRSALERLNAFVGRASKLERAAPHLTLLVTDMHAEINGIPASRYEKYISWVESFARQLGIDIVRSSTYWRSEGLDLAQMRRAVNEPAALEAWKSLPLRAQLVAQASKHAEGTTDFDGAARLYHWACKSEAPIYTRAFPAHIFLTYNDPQLDMLLPDLPRLYLWSFREGASAKPWFTEEG